MVYPQYPDTFWSFKYALKYISKKSAFPPLGLLTVAALLPKDWNIRLLDLNVNKLKDKDLNWADYIMISAMLIQKKSVYEILNRCIPLNKKVIAGGPLFIAASEEFMPLVDHMILNEAENTLPEFLKDLDNGCPKKIYRSTGYPELTTTPIPRWDLINIRNYASLMVQYSRGCPFNCEFCDITSMYGHKTRFKDTDQFLSELQALYDIGWRDSVFIVDDNFIGNIKAIKDMLKELIEWLKIHDYPFGFFTEASLNIVDDEELIDLMVKAGFDQIFIGLETPNTNSLMECSKNQNLKFDMTAAIRKLQSSGIEVLGGYIIGFDSDDDKIFDRQISFIQESGVVTAMVGILSALPNTKLWQRLKKENRLELVATGDNTDGSINFIPKMNKEVLIKGYQKIIKTIYSPRKYYQRISQFLKYYKPAKNRRISAERIKALLKSIFYIGILGNGITQIYYWRLLIKTLILHRRSFAEAMTLIIYGQHFRKISRKISSKAVFIN